MTGIWNKKKKVGTKMASDKKKPKMYYKNEKDREQIRAGDVTSEDSSDPMETDGYGEDADVMNIESYKAPVSKSQSTGLTIKLRKKGVPPKR